MILSIAVLSSLTAAAADKLVDAEVTCIGGIAGLFNSKGTRTLRLIRYAPEDLREGRKGFRISGQVVEVDEQETARAKELFTKNFEEYQKLKPSEKYQLNASIVEKITLFCTSGSIKPLKELVSLGNNTKLSEYATDK